MERIMKFFEDDLMSYDESTCFEKRRYTKNEKEALMKYLTTGEPFIAASGWFLYDYVKKEQTRIGDGGYRKDGYIWLYSDMYHIYYYDAAVTDAFLEHVLSVQTDDYDEALLKEIKSIRLK